MNTKQLLAAAAILAATGSAFAQQTEFVAADANFVSTKTRAEVQAELNQSYVDGSLATLQRDGADRPQLARTLSSKTRAEVVAELNRSYADGSLGTQQRDGADTIQFASTRSRDEVRQEAVASRRNDLQQPSL